MPVVTVYESRSSREVPSKPEVNRLFNFEDSQVVLQVSHSTTGFLLPY